MPPESYPAPGAGRGLWQHRAAPGGPGPHHGPPWVRPGRGVGGGRHRHLRGPLRRSPDARVVAGVCGGLAQATGIDVTLVRIAVVLLSLGSGIGILAYAVAWLFLPLRGEDTTIFSRAVTDRRGLRLVVAIIPVLVVAQVLAGTLHLGYLGSFGWPVFLAVAAAILIRRNASDQERLWINDDLLPMLRTGADSPSRRLLVARTAVGVAVGVAGLLLLVNGHPTGAVLRPVGGALLVVAAIVVVFGPWWLSLVRDLISERQARALAEERAQMAAHVHDSVLQTLALIQRSADDPQHVVRLARAQERELRSWLFEGRLPGALGQDVSTLAEGIGLVQRTVEADHGITVQVVVVGDCPLTDGLRSLLDACREATVNAAKWSGADQVSLYAEVEPDTVMLFVRDRGCGFDPAAVPEDRQGIARSIRERMARGGGSVAIRSAPGRGTEVELSMPRREATG
ncbi:MAG: PspC domain-containing protein [Acidimicrobiales bacterium]